MKEMGWYALKNACEIWLWVGVNLMNGYGGLLRTYGVGMSMGDMVMVMGIGIGVKRWVSGYEDVEKNGFGWCIQGKWK